MRHFFRLVQHYPLSAGIGGGFSFAFSSRRVRIAIMRDHPALFFAGPLGTIEARSGCSKALSRAVTAQAAVPRRRSAGDTGNASPARTADFRGAREKISNPLGKVRGGRPAGQ